MMQVNELERKSTFLSIPSLATLPAIQQEEVKHISTDANLFYQLGLGITTGKFSK